MVRNISNLALAGVLALAGAMGTAAGPAAAATIAYDNLPAPLQNYGGSLGLDFTVNSGIDVVQLGVFDNGLTANLAGKDGTGVTVAIFNVATQTQVGPSLSFSPTNTGTQINADAFLAVPLIHLTPGTYSIVAANDINSNSSGSPNGFSTENSGGGLISFVGSGRYTTSGSNALVFPTTVDGGPANRYNAGTFQFDVPEPASLVVLSAGLIGLGVVRRRR